MKIPASSELPTGRTDTPELQDVLTRYIESARSYSRAAGRTRLPELASMLDGVAARREEIAGELASLIARQGGKPEQEASARSTLRCGLLTVRRLLAGEPFEAVVAECIRGEEAILATLERALDSQDVTHGHARALRSAREDVTVTIRSFHALLQSTRTPAAVALGAPVNGR